tara:strand:+ start:58141 stop:59595 length:1455 start_codon:yes stop_codon:yes gene_type:complete
MPVLGLLESLHFDEEASSLLTMSMIVIAALIGGVVGAFGALVFSNRKATQQALAHASLQERARANDEQVERLKAECVAAHEDLKGLRTQKESLQIALNELQTRREEELKNFEQKEAFLKKTHEDLSEAFRGLSAEALKNNNQSFLALAKESLARFQDEAKGDLNKRQEAIQQLMNPMKETLAQFDQTVQGMEKTRIHAYSGLSEQLKQVANTQVKLETETAHLVKALRTPHVRGQWGELQLRRSVELAGMVNYVDFDEQESVVADNKLQRPDMIIRLPNGRNVVVDAKAPITAYLEALEAKEEVTIRDRLSAHARHIRDHIKKLSEKAYWKQFDPTPDFVVLFLPGEPFFSAALQEDPALIDFGVDQKIILATPTTLIALLRSVAFGWKEASIAKEAQVVSTLGRELYERMSVLGGHFGDLHKNLERTVGAYNKTVRSMETRVLPTARKFQDLHIGSEAALPDLQPAELAPNLPQAPELVGVED